MSLVDSVLEAKLKKSLDRTIEIAVKDEKDSPGNRKVMFVAGYISSVFSGKVSGPWETEGKMWNAEVDIKVSSDDWLENKLGKLKEDKRLHKAIITVKEWK